MHASRLLLQAEAVMGLLGVKGDLGALSALMILLANTRNLAWTADMSVKTNNKKSLPSLSIGQWKQAFGNGGTCLFPGQTASGMQAIEELVQSRLY